MRPRDIDNRLVTGRACRNWFCGIDKGGAGTARELSLAKRLLRMANLERSEYDLLAENNLISFHRFQIFVWTLILGIMFVANGRQSRPKERNRRR
jgi:hypothetical protein